MTEAKKYEFTGEIKECFGHTLRRIKSLRDFGVVKVGDVGGWIEGEKNLSHIGDAWVYDNALVYGNAMVYDNAQVYDDAQVYDGARVCGNALVNGNAMVYDNAQVCGDALVTDNVRVCGDALVTNNARVCGDAELFEKALIEKYDDYIYIGPIGSRGGFTTVFRTKNVAIVKCGCFSGNLAEFYQEIEETHGDNKFGREYKKFIELARIRFDEEGL